MLGKSICSSGYTEAEMTEAIYPDGRGGTAPSVERRCHSVTPGVNRAKSFSPNSFEQR
jgi:hypothetical protein